jgi:hypothetical protein
MNIYNLKAAFERDHHHSNIEEHRPSIKEKVTDYLETIKYKLIEDDEELINNVCCSRCIYHHLCY